MSRAGAVNDFYIELGFDDSKALKGLNDFESKLKSMAVKFKEVAKAEAVGNNFSAQMKSQAKAVDQTTDSYRKLREQLEAIVVAQKKIRPVSQPRTGSGGGRQGLGGRGGSAVMTESERREGMANNMLYGTTLASLRKQGIDGATSAKQFEERIKSLRDSAGSVHELRQEYTKLSAKMREVTTQFRKQSQETDDLSTKMYKLSGGFSTFAMKGAGLYAIFDALSSIKDAAIDALKYSVKVGMQFDALKASMLAVTGTQEKANKELEYASQLADKYGMSLTGATEGWMKFLAASNGKMQIQQLRELYEGATKLSTLYGLSADRQKLVFKALEQMMSKGRIQAEELRSQLGEHLPAAVSMMAKAMGVTEMQLNKLMKQGKVVSSEVLPKFGLEMSRVAERAGGLDEKLRSARVEILRLTAAQERAAETLYSGGLNRGLARVSKSTRNFLSDNQALWNMIGRTAEGVLGLVSELVDSLKPAMKLFTRLYALLSAVGNIIDYIDAKFQQWSGSSIFEKLANNLNPLGGLVDKLADLTPQTVKDFVTPTQPADYSGVKSDSFSSMFKPMYNINVTVDTDGVVKEHNIEQLAEGATIPDN